MTDTEKVEERILNTVRVITGVAMVVLLWCAMCGYLS